MKKENFTGSTKGDITDILERIRESAHNVHANVNEYYDKTKPYSLHLDMVAAVAERYADLVLTSEDDRLPLIFAAYYHDSIEDARLSYNDVTKIARQFMSDSQAYLAAEIVFALTNDKGRTRAERAGERYYEGIRNTPYAPFTKLCDRIANATYSHDNASVSENNQRMKNLYLEELPHFLSAINPHSTSHSLPLAKDKPIDAAQDKPFDAARDKRSSGQPLLITDADDRRFAVPETMVTELKQLLEN